MSQWRALDRRGSWRMTWERHRVPYAATIRRFENLIDRSTGYHWCVDHVRRDRMWRTVYLIETGSAPSLEEARTQCERVKARIDADAATAMGVSRHRLRPGPPSRRLVRA